MLKLSVEEFIRLRNIIYDKAGLFFETKKIYFVKKRLEKRMREMNISDITEYINHLKFKDKYGKEVQQLLNLMTTNETYFFREDNQLNAFADHCLPEVLKRKREARDSRLRLWSAGCSSGEEAYTLGILLKEKITDMASWQVEILATDIDTDILAAAKKGQYSDRAIRFTPPYIKSKYFTPMGEMFNLSQQVKQMVTFQHINLMDSVKMRFVKSIDFIFCRNVLIYFDEQSRRAVVANFYDSLRPGGFIYLGHSESISRINTAFNIARAGGLIVHQKPVN